MDDYLKEAIEIARAQASVRTMLDDEITAFIKKVAAGLRSIAEGSDEAQVSPAAMRDNRKSIKEKSVTCLECGQSFKILTKRHLAQHGLTTEEYLEKYGLKKGTSLVSKSLQRARRNKMRDMKLWERRSKDGASTKAKAAPKAKAKPAPKAKAEAKGK